MATRPRSSRQVIPIRTPCAAVKHTKSFQGLLFGYSAPTPLQVKVATLIPPKENAVIKRFPVFESILGMAYPIHECLVCVARPSGRVFVFLIAYQERPQTFPNPSLSNLAPDADVLDGEVPQAEVYGEILAVRSGEVVLVQDMGGHTSLEAAKRAVRAFIVKLVAHRAQHRGKRNAPLLPTLIEV